jgi:hypothetical protein
MTPRSLETISSSTKQRIRNNHPSITRMRAFIATASDNKVHADSLGGLNDFGPSQRLAGRCDTEIYSSSTQETWIRKRITSAAKVRLRIRIIFSIANRQGNAPL